MLFPDWQHAFLCDVVQVVSFAVDQLQIGPSAGQVLLNVVVVVPWSRTRVASYAVHMEDYAAALLISSRRIISLNVTW